MSQPSIFFFFWTFAKIFDDHTGLKGKVWERKKLELWNKLYIENIFFSFNEKRVKLFWALPSPKYKRVASEVKVKLDEWNLAIKCAFCFTHVLHVCRWVLLSFSLSQTPIKLSFTFYVNYSGIKSFVNPPWKKKN